MFTQPLKYLYIVRVKNWERLFWKEILFNAFQNRQGHFSLTSSSAASTFCRFAWVASSSTLAASFAASRSFFRALELIILFLDAYHLFTDLFPNSVRPNPPAYLPNLLPHWVRQICSTHVKDNLQLKFPRVFKENGSNIRETMNY